MRKQITALVVDSQPLVRWALRKVLNSLDNIYSIDEAASATEAYALISKHPNLVITELNLPDGCGISLTAELVDSCGSRIVATTQDSSWNQVESFINAGGLAFVPKTAPMHDFENAIRAALANKRWISPNLRSVVTSEYEPGNKADQPYLTPREKEIITLIASGLTNNQIADRLCISHNTVESHRYHIFKKLGIRRLAQLVQFAVQHGLWHDE